MFDFVFSNINEFLAMGKHGFYVWLCYGLTLFVVLTNITLVLVKKNSLIEEIQAEKIRKQKQHEQTSSKT